MATPQLVSVQEFTESQYAQLIESNADLQPENVLVKAEAAIQSRVGRTFSVTSHTERFRAESQTVWVRNRPIVEVTGMKRRYSIQSAWDILDPTLVEIESGPGYITAYTPIRGYQVELTYSAGYLVIPEDIKEAVILQAVLFSYQDLEIYGAGDSKEPGIRYINEDIDRLLMPFRASGSVYH